ncbi:hypothetical protein [Hyalangium minutum]|uniref:Uncharacterized protein n=1 Tax=Hyalangium minutum TaxID=394096 RepID=A0A085W534_9BACT|nr:hypothetical protein [Hyalangium minutum]KFE62797.1 hypothetical protein DB31_3911 [Hyalangium minutum]
MVSEYDEGMSAAERVLPDSPDAAANIRVPYQQVRRCREDHPSEVQDYPDVEVQTSRGTRGCGERRISLTSNVDGTGAWTRPIRQAQDDDYIPKPCDKMEKAAPPPPGKDFESAHAGIQGLCGPTARIYYQEWQHRTNALGVAVQRQAGVICQVVDETRPKWWMESF